MEGVEMEGQVVENAESHISLANSEKLKMEKCVLVTEFATRARLLLSRNRKQTSE
jgi:hypothetical protein